MAKLLFNPISGNFDTVYDKAEEIKYVPIVGGDWTVPLPTTAQEGLDSVSARLSYVLSLSNTQQIYIDAVAGSDTNGNGSVLQPFQTIQKGVLTTLANPALTYVFYLAPGTYTGANSNISGNISLIGNNASIAFDLNYTAVAGDEVYPVYQGVNFNLFTTDLSAANIALPVFIHCGVNLTRFDSSTGPRYIQIIDSNISSLSVKGNISTSNCLFTGTCGVENVGSLLVNNCVVGISVVLQSQATLSMTASTFVGSITGTTSGMDVSVVRADSSSLSQGGVITGCNVSFADKAEFIAYTPTTPGDWIVQPIQTADALDILANTKFPTPTGLSSQYIRGDGSVADFPTFTGGGSSVSYYLNGSVSQGIILGHPYYQMSKTPIVGAGTDFTATNVVNGLISEWLTDAGDPAFLNIPAGSWDVQGYFSLNQNNISPTFYVELLKYDGFSFTSICDNSANPEAITNGTTIDLYYTSLAVPATSLTLTDRLAIRIYVNTLGNHTVTHHTEDSHLTQIITTFSTGINSLNGLSEQVQTFGVGTSGNDFNIDSVSGTHTFNLPNATAFERGALTSADWVDFDSKVDTAINLGIGNQVFKQDNADTLEFRTLVAGSGISITQGTDTITIDSTGSVALPIKDEGSQITASVASIDFTGAGVTATSDGSGNVTVDIAGGGSTSGQTALELLANAEVITANIGPVTGFYDGNSGAYSTRTVVVNNQIAIYSGTLLYVRSTGGTYRCKRFSYNTASPAQPILVGTNIVYDGYYISNTNFSGAAIQASNWNSISGFSINSYNSHAASSATIGLRMGTSTSLYASSADGITWTSRSFNVAPTASPQRLIFAGTLFFLFDGDTTYLTSPDGLTWTSRTSPFSGGLNSNLIFDSTSGLYIHVLSNTNSIYTSPDGITWTSRTNPVSGNSCYSIGVNSTSRITIVGSSAILNSTDGITWTPFYDNKIIPFGDLIQLSTGNLLYFTRGIGEDRRSFTVLSGRYLGSETFIQSPLYVRGILEGGTSSTNQKSEILLLGSSSTSSTVPNIGPGYAYYDIIDKEQKYTSTSIPITLDGIIGNIDANNFVDCTSVKAYTTLPVCYQYVVMNNSYVFEPFATLTGKIRSTIAPNSATLSCITSNVIPSSPLNTSQWHPHAMVAVSSNSADSVIWGYYSSGGNLRDEYSISTGITGAFRTIEVHNNVFIAVGDSGVSMRYVHSASNPPNNPANWTSANLSSVSTGNFTKLVAGNGVFIAITSETGTSARNIYVSSDLGISWSLVTLSGFVADAVNNVVVFFLKGKFYAFGDNNGPLDYKRKCFSSVDGVTWTEESSDLVQYLTENRDGGPTFPLLGLKIKKCNGRTYALRTFDCLLLPAFEE